MHQPCRVASGATLDVSGVTNGFSIPSGQTLSGSGTVTGSLTMLGTLSPGTLGINGNLVLASTTPLAFELGTSPDVVAVSGNLTLGGQLAVTAGPGFGAGTYTLFTYTGTLTMAGGGLNLANMPAGFAYAISTGVAGQVIALCWRGGHAVHAMADPVVRRSERTRRRRRCRS